MHADGATALAPSLRLLVSLTRLELEWVAPLPSPRRPSRSACARWRAARPADGVSPARAPAARLTVLHPSAHGPAAAAAAPGELSTPGEYVYVRGIRLEHTHLDPMFKGPFRHSLTRARTRVQTHTNRRARTRKQAPLPNPPPPASACSRNDFKPEGATALAPALPHLTSLEMLSLRRVASLLPSPPPEAFEPCGRVPPSSATRRGPGDLNAHRYLLLCMYIYIYIYIYICLGSVIDGQISWYGNDLFRDGDGGSRPLLRSATHTPPRCYGHASSTPLGRAPRCRATDRAALAQPRVLGHRTKPPPLPTGSPGHALT